MSDSDPEITYDETDPAVESVQEITSVDVATTEVTTVTVTEQVTIDDDAITNALTEASTEVATDVHTDVTEDGEVTLTTVTTTVTTEVVTEEISTEESAPEADITEVVVTPVEQVTEVVEVISDEEMEEDEVVVVAAVAEPELEAEAVLEVESEPEVEAMPEEAVEDVVVVETEAEVEAEPELESEDEVEAEAVIEVESVPEVEALPEAVEDIVIVEAEAEVEAEPELESEDEVEAEAVIEVESVPEVEALPEAVEDIVIVEAEAEVEAEPALESEDEVEAESVPEVEALPEAVEDVVVVEAEADVEAELESEDEVEEESVPEVEALPEEAVEDVIVVEAEAEVEAEPELESEDEVVEEDVEMVEEPEVEAEPETIAIPEEPVVISKPEPVAIPEPEPVAIPEPEPVAIPEPVVVSKPLKRKAEPKPRVEPQPKKAPKPKIPPPPKKIRPAPAPKKPDGTEYSLPKPYKALPQGSLVQEHPKQPQATNGEAVARPSVTVFNDQGEASGTVTLPAVFKASIRPDVVNFVHTNIAKNSRQAYCVSREAGHQTSAESWGTGRAVARIPRVRGGGTHRSGQGAFGNMCRSGRMFAPTKTYRKWHRAINQDQRRFAVCSAVAASALPALVMARGHKIDKINEVPLVVSDGIESITKTKNAVALLEKLGAYDDVEKCADSKKIRAGKGKLRNRRFTMRRGPLIIYNEDHGIKQSFRNLPGVEVLNVDRLNLLKLAPGGHLGRFCVWSQSAFTKLDSIYGTWRKSSTEKSNYNLPRAKMTVADVAQLINSDAIQSVIRPAKPAARRAPIKKNPLKNKNVLFRLNPHAKTTKRAATLASQKAARGKAVDAARGAK